MRCLPMIAALALCLAPLSHAELAACGPELDEKINAALQEEQTHQRRIFHVTETRDWISWDYEDGAMSPEEYEYEMGNAAVEEEKAEMALAEVRVRLADLRAQQAGCPAAGTP